MQTQTPKGSKNLQTRLDRDLCAPVPALNSVAKATGCSYSGLSGGADYLIWGDSHAAMITPQLSEALERRGMHGAVATMAACPPLIDVYTSKRKNRKECSELADQIVGFVTENRVDTVILASRWAGLASPVRAPGNGSLSKELFSRSRNGQPITFQDAIQETANALKAAGADVVIVGPVPEINFHVPDMVMRSRHLGHDLPHPDRKDFDLRQSIILEAMKDVGKTPWVTVVYPHKFLCDARYCRIAKGSVPLYRDDDHLSRAGVGLILDGIVTAVMPSEPSKDRGPRPSQALQPKACLRQSPALQAGAPGDPD